jgi:formylglycine-generating enzyme required for sulfatase activity
VGRFRRFVDAVVKGGWLPTAHAGKHDHLNGKSGLNATGSGYETGWDATWTSNLASSAAGWNANLACDATLPTWTPAPSGANELRPINCVTWFEAYAFCIWDSGFLPSEAEWNYAAAGGTEQRVYPWGASAPGADALLAVYGCYYGGGCTSVQAIAPVGSVVAGDGKWGQSDLAGNMWEWTLDWYQSMYPDPCTDCFASTAGADRVVRSGDFYHDGSYILASSRGGANGTPAIRDPARGIRCARVP